MTNAIPIRELAHHTGRYVERAQKGERLPISKNGKLVAVIIPPEEQDLQREALLATGVLEPSHPGQIGWIDSLPSVPDEEKFHGSLSDALIAMREEEDR